MQVQKNIKMGRSNPKFNQNLTCMVMSCPPKMLIINKSQ